MWVYRNGSQPTTSRQVRGFQVWHRLRLQVHRPCLRQCRLVRCPGSARPGLERSHPRPRVGCSEGAGRGSRASGIGSPAAGGLSTAHGAGGPIGTHPGDAVRRWQALPLAGRVGWEGAE